MFDPKDFPALNSATKYPSIPTYHELGDRGILTDKHVEFPPFSVLIATEKVDGANARIIMHPDGDYLIGSREDLLFAQGDRVGNPSMGIVDAIKPIADRAAEATNICPHTVVFYGEVYGHKAGPNAKQYTGSNAVGFRLFDVAYIERGHPVLDKSPAEIAAWRDAGGQQFAVEPDLAQWAANLGVYLTPRIPIGGAKVPAGVPDTYEWLQQTLDGTRAALDGEAGGKPEGIVLRTFDRSTIVKIRFEDYRRTVERRSK